MKNEIEKFLKEKFGDNVCFVEERYWSESQAGSDIGYRGNDLEKGLEGFINLDDAKVFVENLL